MYTCNYNVSTKEEHELSYQAKYLKMTSTLLPIYHLYSIHVLQDDYKGREICDHKSLVLVDTAEKEMTSPPVDKTMITYIPQECASLVKV